MEENVSRPLNGRKVLLIGGAGFIGHHLAIALKNAGADVVVLDGFAVNNVLSLISENNKLGHRSPMMDFVFQRLDALNAASIPVVTHDARDYHVLSKHVATIKPDTVIHLAAVAHANQSNKDPNSTFDHSLRTLENALDSCRDGVKRFIYFSSSMVYGNFKGGVVTEDSECDPMGIYGSLKLAGERMVMSYSQVFGLPYTIVRPSALYGERCISGRVSQVIIENALQGKDIMIQGDGSDRLDFTYIADLCQGICRVVESEKAVKETFNLTYGAGRSTNDLVALLQEYFPGIKIKREERDKLMPARGTLSIQKARTLLGYEPQYPLEKGFVKYVEWYLRLAQRGLFARATAANESSELAGTGLIPAVERYEKRSSANNPIKSFTASKSGRILTRVN